MGGVCVVLVVWVLFFFLSSQGVLVILQATSIMDTFSMNDVPKFSRALAGGVGLLCLLTVT